MIFFEDPHGSISSVFRGVFYGLPQERVVVLVIQDCTVHFEDTIFHLAAMAENHGSMSM
jgi:hypothetical protein